MVLISNITVIRQVIINIKDTDFIFQIFRNKCKNFNIRCKFNTDIQNMSWNMFCQLLTSIIEASPHKKMVCQLLQSGTNSRVMQISLHNWLSIFSLTNYSGTRRVLSWSVASSRHNTIIYYPAWCSWWLIGSKWEAWISSWRISSTRPKV